MNEPLSTALLLASLGLLMGTSVLASRAAGRFGVPVALFFLLVGMLAGSEGIGGIDFEDYAFGFRVGTVALVLILFDGGLNTPLVHARRYLAPAGVLATLGVVGTAGALAFAAHAIWDIPWGAALVLGSIVSSTDAAAVFAVLRGSGLHLKQRVGLTLELESGANDPMAVILTITFTTALVEGVAPGISMIFDVALQLVVGGVCGVGVGLFGRTLLRRVVLDTGGLYPVLTVALAFLAFAVPTLLDGSGFLSVYVAGMLIGADTVRYRNGLLRVHNALAWLSQVTMFLVLGLLVFPSRLWEVAPLGLGLALVLALVARPLVVFLCLLPFRYPAAEVLYICWIGLRGAVPITLATFPVMAGAPGAGRIFDIIFFIVVVNAFIPGATVGWLTRKLKLSSNEPPPPVAALEMTSTQLLNGELHAYYVQPASAVCGAKLSELPFPETAVAALVVRGAELIPPRGQTRLMPHDHVYVFCRAEDLGLIQLLFGSSEA